MVSVHSAFSGQENHSRIPKCYAEVEEHPVLLKKPLHFQSHEDQPFQKEPAFFFS